MSQANNSQEKPAAKPVPKRVLDPDLLDYSPGEWERMGEEAKERRRSRSLAQKDLQFLPAEFRKVLQEAKDKRGLGRSSAQSQPPTQ